MALPGKILSDQPTNQPDIVFIGDLSMSKLREPYSIRAII